MEKSRGKIFLLFFSNFLFLILVFCYKIGLGKIDITSKARFYAIYIVKNHEKQNGQSGKRNKRF